MYKFFVHGNTAQAFQSFFTKKDWCELVPIIELNDINFSVNVDSRKEFV